jgi:hypothetical protein
MSNTKKNRICYTGIGARKNGNHTRKQFLKVMESSAKDCKHFIARSGCSNCKKTTKLMLKYYNQNMNKKNLAKTEKKIELLKKKCNSCTKKKMHNCSLQNFIRYSGALPGKCA